MITVAVTWEDILCNMQDPCRPKASGQSPHLSKVLPLAVRCKLVDSACKLIDVTCKLVDSSQHKACTAVPGIYQTMILANC